jgi:hypothetical protein
MDIGLGLVISGLATLAFYGVTAILEATGVLQPKVPPTISAPAGPRAEESAGPLRLSNGGSDHDDAYRER